MNMMDIPAGWEKLDSDGRFDHIDTHFTEHVGPVFVRGAEGARQIAFRVEPHMCNPAGICHGGMLMTVMDVGLGFALHNALGGIRFTPTISLNFDFLSPGKLGDFLVCEGAATRHTNNTGFVSGQLIGSDGPVLNGSGLFKITDIGVGGLGIPDRPL